MIARAALGLALLASMLFAGCTGEGEADKKAAQGPIEQVKVGIVYDNGGLGDKSFNDSASRGIERAKKELGAEVIQIESKDVKDYEANIREVATKGCDLVIAVGINMQTATEVVAQEFPGTKFAIIDASVKLPNVRSLLFKEEEGSFLVGYLAGLMTKSYRIGFVGGQDIPLIHKFEIGFLAGAEEANPDVVLLPPKYIGNWNNVEDARVAANVLFASGADIVYHAAGRAGLGVIRAAAENKKYAIGVDSDQDGEEPGHVLTSMVKRVDNSVFATIKDVKDGAFSAGETVYDLKAGGVGYSELKYTREAIGADNIERLEAMATKIRDGQQYIPANELDLKRLRKMRMARIP